jgi:hypothetical protein
MEPITAEVDGCRVSELWSSGLASRTTVFELLKIARIEPVPRRIPGSQRPAAFLTGAQERMMRALIDRLKDGATLGQLRAEATTAIERAESRTVPDDPAPSEAPEPLPLVERLQAIEAAMRTGAPLTTADVRALLLEWPGAAVVQRGTPDELYENPIDTYVAGKIGSPHMNILKATLGPDLATLDTALGKLASTRQVKTGRAGEAALVGIRPSDLRPASAGEAAVPSRVHLIEPLGDVTVVSVEAAGETLRLVLPEQSASHMKPGDELPIAIDPNKSHIFRAASGQVMA